MVTMLLPVFLRSSYIGVCEYGTVSLVPNQPERENGCVWEYEAVPPEPDQPERVCVWEYDAVPPEIDQPEGQMVCLGIWGSGREVELGLLVHCSDFRKGLRVLRYI